MEYNDDIYGASVEDDNTEDNVTGSTGEVEPKLGWNFGAFIFQPWFAIATNSWLGLLCLIPTFGVIWTFVCGAMGARWAWESGKFKNAKTFNAVMSSWNRAGLVASIIVGGFLLLVIIVMIISVLYSIGSSVPDNYGMWSA